MKLQQLWYPGYWFWFNCENRKYTIKMWILLNIVVNTGIVFDNKSGEKWRNLSPPWDLETVQRTRQWDQGVCQHHGCAQEQVNSIWYQQQAWPWTSWYLCRAPVQVPTPLCKARTVPWAVETVTNGMSVQTRADQVCSHSKWCNEADPKIRFKWLIQFRLSVKSRKSWEVSLHVFIWLY